jgi:hypothetical protein
MRWWKIRPPVAACPEAGRNLSSFFDDPAT